jgi:nitrite reductase (NADH) small subunit
VGVGPLDAFPLNEVRVLEVGGRSIGVVRTAEAVYAVRNVCPHQGAPICRGSFGGTMMPSAPGEKEYGLEHRVLRCPWHAWEFDVRTGEALFGTSDRRLVTYRTEVRGGDVFVYLAGPRADRAITPSEGAGPAYRGDCRLPG